MKRFVWAAILVAAAVPAQADVFEPTLAQVCTPVPTPAVPGKLNSALVLGALLNAAGVSFSDIDADPRDSVSYEQKVAAVLAGGTYCSLPGSKCASDPDARNATTKKLAAAQVLLIDYFQRHANQVRTGEGGYQFKFERNTANIRDFFVNPKSALVPACIASTTTANKPNPPVGDDKSRALGRLLVRNSVADLTVGQSDPAFKNLQRASISITNDQLQTNTTYNIQAVVGYGIGQTPIPGWSGAYGEITPYVTYTRQFVNGPNPAKTSNVDNIGAGFTSDLLFPEIGLQQYLPLTQGMYNDLAFSPQIVHSNRTDTDVVSGTLTYTPYINPAIVPGIATTERVGDFLLMLMPQANVVWGEVTTSGVNSVLKKTGSFERVGGHLAFSANADAGPLQGIKFTTAYDFYQTYGVLPVSEFGLFTATLSYTIPKQEFWSIQLKYINGRNLDTLEQQRLVTLGVGLKY